MGEADDVVTLRRGGRHDVVTELPTGAGDEQTHLERGPRLERLPPVAVARGTTRR